MSEFLISEGRCLFVGCRLCVASKANSESRPSQPINSAVASFSNLKREPAMSFLGLRKGEHLAGFFELVS